MKARIARKVLYRARNAGKRRYRRITYLRAGKRIGWPRVSLVDLKELMAPWRERLERILYEPSPIMQLIEEVAGRGPDWRGPYPPIA